MSIIRALRTTALSLIGRGVPFAAALLSIIVAHAQSNYAAPYTFSTLAGSPTIVGERDGTGPAAVFLSPSGTAVDGNGNVYVADQINTIRKITPAGVVTTIAGVAGLSGAEDGQGTAARFNDPVGICVDGSGNLYVTDAGNDEVRKITPGGLVSTFAGIAGQGGTADGQGTAAQFSNPIGIAVDGAGNVYVADNINNTVRKITPGGLVSTLAGDPGVVGQTDATGTTARFHTPTGIAVDSSGNVFVADALNFTIRKVTPGGTVTTIAGSPKLTGNVDATGAAARFAYPYGISVDSSDNVYVADLVNNNIRKVSSGGVVTTLAGIINAGYADGTGSGARFNTPFGATVDGNGNVFVPDTVNGTVRKITSGGTVTTIAGTPGGGSANGTGSAAGFFSPSQLAVDSTGNVFVADELNDIIRKITPGGVVTTLAGVPGLTGSSDGQGSAATFFDPYGIAVDASDNVYVSDTGNDTIRKITSAGVVSTMAGVPLLAGSTNGTGSAALFSIPVGVAVDGNGNLYVAEQGNFDIRKITSGDVVTTLAGTAGAVGSSDGTGAAAKFNLPAGLAVDGNGNVFVADYANDTIREITAAGVVTTIAGQSQIPGSKDGTGTAAQFYLPVGIAVDASGNLFVAEQKNNTIREVTPQGVVTTLAGKTGVSGSTDGTGSDALFSSPEDVAIDGSGTLYVADLLNNTIRKGSLSATPQITTQPADQFVSVGGSATFSVTVAGSGSVSYQWNFNGSAISGATGSSYTVTNAQAGNAGTYSVTVSNSNGSTASQSANLSVNSGTTSVRLSNISTRALVGTGANILIPGFVVGGTGIETLLIRADGPSLSQFGVTGILAQPILTVLDSTGTIIATNTGWGNNANAAQIITVSAQVHAFAFASGSADSALIVNLSPGAYTVQVSGVPNTKTGIGTTGVALAEIYEVSSTGTRLTNISTRAQVGTGGNILIPGFVISGSGTEQLLIRADGPSLTQFGVGGVLGEPTLNVFDSTNTVIASNTGWTTASNSADIASIAATVHAFAFQAGSADSADLANLGPGAYTIQISGANATTGVALAEVYEIP